MRIWNGSDNFDFVMFRFGFGFEKVRVGNILVNFEGWVEFFRKNVWGRVFLVKGSRWVNG